MRIHKNNSGDAYAGYIVLLIVGSLLLMAGIFMVTSIHTWEIFSVWLPPLLVVMGILLLGTESYSTTAGVLFILTGVLIWLHEVGISYLPHLTYAIDWLFVISGGSIVSFTLAKIIDSKRQRGSRLHRLH